MEIIRLDIIPKGIEPICHVKQYDKGRAIRFELMDGLQGYTLTNETVSINIRKPDGNIVTEDLSVISGNSYVDVITTVQMTAVAGYNKCTLKIVKDSAEIGTIDFKMQVKEDPTAGGVPSESEYNNLERQVSNIVADNISTISSSEAINEVDVATFESVELPLKSVTVSANAIQESGTPTPTSPKLITGISEIEIIVSGNEPNDVTRYLVDLGATYYGGVLSIIKDKTTFTSNKKVVNLSDLSWAYSSGVFTASLTDGQKINTNGIIDYMCETYEVKGSQSSTAYSSNNFVLWHGKSASKNWVFVRDNRYTDPAEFKDNVTGKLVYVSTDETVVELEDTPISTKSGTNHISSTNGVVSVEYFVSVDEAIENSAGNILYGKKWAVCGDSFTSGATNTLIGHGKYYDKKAIYPYLIGNRNNMDILKFFDGGRTLAYPATPSGFTNSLTCPTAAYYYQNIPEDTDYITIYLGINDEHHATTGEIIPIGTISDNTTETYLGAWNVVLSWIMENRPKAHIGMIVTNGIENDDAYRQGQIAIAQKYGIPYIDMNGDARTPAMIRTSNPNIAAAVKQILLDKWEVSDSNSHPNDDAHIFEATFIEAFLRNI